MTLALRKLSSNKVWLLVAILAVGLLVPQFAFAGLMDGLANILGHLIYWLMVLPFAKFLEWELWILPLIAQYSNFTGQAGVIKGWVALRDLANMFFILILLVIAFSTILRIQKYGYRQLLSRFLIMAILINFSMTIVGLVIDLSQIIMLTFVSAIKDVAAGNIVVLLGLDKVMNAGPGAAGSASYLVAMFLGAIMLIVAVVIVAVYVMMLAMRIVKLWIEIVLAPIAFLAYTFPDTQKFYNEWSQELIKDISVGPSLAFFLWLAFTIAGNGNIGPEIIAKDQQDTGGARTAIIKTEVSEAAEPANLINFVIGIAILMAGLQMSAKAGGVGAGLAKTASDKMSAVPGRVGRKVGGIAKGTAVNLRDSAVEQMVTGGGDSKVRKGPIGWLNVGSGGAMERAAYRARGRKATTRMDKISEAEASVPEAYERQFKEARTKRYRTFAARGLGLTSSADVAVTQEAVDSGEHIKDMPKALKHLYAAGDMARIRKLQAIDARAYDSSEEVDRRIEGGHESILDNVAAHTLGQVTEDEDGNVIYDPNESAMLIADTVLENSSIDARRMADKADVIPGEGEPLFLQAISDIEDGIVPAEAFKEVAGKYLLDVNTKAGKQLYMLLRAAPHLAEKHLNTALQTLPEGRQAEAFQGAVEVVGLKKMNFEKVLELDLDDKDDSNGRISPHEIFSQFARVATVEQQRRLIDTDQDGKFVEETLKIRRASGKSVAKPLVDYEKNKYKPTEENSDLVDQYGNPIKK